MPRKALQKNVLPENLSETNGDSIRMLQFRCLLDVACAHAPLDINALQSFHGSRNTPDG